MGLIARYYIEVFNRVRDMLGHDLPITAHHCGSRPGLDYIVEKLGGIIKRSSTGGLGQTTRSMRLRSLEIKCMERFILYFPQSIQDGGIRKTR